MKTAYTITHNMVYEMIIYENEIQGTSRLFLCSLFWGMAFAAQSNAMNYMGPYTFVFLRSAITSLVLFSVHPLMVRTRMIPAENRENRASLWKVGALCGVFLVAATLLQQIGLVTTSTAKSGFITALYIVIVPILGLFIGKKPQITILLGVAMSLVGLYFLCMKDALRIDPGDLLTFFSAIVFALHILVIDRFGGNLDSVKLSAVQFLFAAVCSGNSWLSHWKRRRLKTSPHAGRASFTLPYSPARWVILCRLRGRNPQIRRSLR